MSEEYKVRLADDDDLERFGSKPLEIGFPVEPWPSEREREQFEQENQRMLEDYDAEEVSVTRLRDGRILCAVATYADGETEILFHGSLGRHPGPTYETNSKRSRTPEQ